MRIAAAICWYDERPSWLARCVRSVAPLVDVIISADGPWLGYPHAEVQSPPEQRTAIYDAAHDAGLGVIELPAGLWPSQPAKRTALYRSAWRAADHVLVIDADEELRCPDPARVREMIDAASADAVNVCVQTPIGRGTDGGRDTATAPSGTRWQSRILRAAGTLTVGPRSHRTLSTASRVIYCDNAHDHLGLVDHEIGVIKSIPADVVAIVNRTHSRDDDRMSAKREYGMERQQRGYD